MDIDNAREDLGYEPEYNYKNILKIINLNKNLKDLMGYGKSRRTIANNS